MTPSSPKKRPVLLADRDGTLIRDVPYLSRIEDVALLPGVPEALARLNRAGVPVAIVTNQSGVARGYFPEEFVLETQVRIMELLEAGGARVDAFYYCPHLEPEAGLREGFGGLPHLLRPCGCRKPSPGLLLRALSDLSGDPSRSAIVGDADRDMKAGEAAGCHAGYRILSDGERTEGGSRITLVRSFSEAVDLYLAWLSREGTAGRAPGSR
ncbi:MAG: D-glycero-alpha-D-manno-heptose-1,7-bisphosphate 7-phosphatase [Leptospirillia bacterium]